METNQIKDEDILTINNNLIIDSIILPWFFNFKDKIINVINPSSIALEESKEDNQNLPINSLNKRIPGITIPVQSSSVGLNTKNFFVYPKKVTIFTKAENKFEFIKVNSKEKF